MAVLHQLEWDYKVLLKHREVLKGRERLLGYECPDTLMALQKSRSIEVPNGRP